MVAFAFNDGGNFPANQRYPIGMLAQLTVRAIQQGGQRIDRAVDRQFAPQFRANVIVPGDVRQRALQGIRKMILIEEAWLRHVSLVYDCLTFHSTRWK